MLDSKIEWPKNKVDRVLNSIPSIGNRYKLWWRNSGQNLDLTIVGVKKKRVVSLQFYGLTASQKQEIDDYLEAQKLINL